MAQEIPIPPAHDVSNVAEMADWGSSNPVARWAEHMAPGVVWLEDPAFAEAFADITTTQENSMSAHTNTIDPRTGAAASFPAFVNIRFEGGRAILTVRGDPTYVEADDDNEAYQKAGKQVEATFEQGDWDQFVAEATRERGLVPGG